MLQTSLILRDFSFWVIWALLAYFSVRFDGGRPDDIKVSKKKKKILHFWNRVPLKLLCYTNDITKKDFLSIS